MARKETTLNYKNHLTHWRGKPLKEMSREDLLEALQQSHATLQQVNEQHLAHLAKQGKAAYDIYG